MHAQDEQLIQAIQFLLNKLPEQLQQDAGISVARLAVLKYLLDNGPSGLMSIARHRKVSGATMSKLVASLVSEGYLLKAQSKSDRRSKLFLVTSLARQKVAEENEQQITLLNERFKNITDEQQALIIKSVQILKNVL